MWRGLNCFRSETTDFRCNRAATIITVNPLSLIELVAHMHTPNRIELATIDLKDLPLKVMDSAKKKHNHEKRRNTISEYREDAKSFRYGCIQRIKQRKKEQAFPNLRRKKRYKIEEKIAMATKEINL